jgi:CO/xanthine dehydrogenase FAD-binding subunit
LQAFDYRAPNTIAEAVGILSDLGERARPIAGGTDVLVQLRVGRLDQIEMLVDVKRIPDLNQLIYSPSSGFTIGAAVPCYQIAGDSIARTLYPGLIDGVAIIGGSGIQGRATIGGNLANSSPSGDSIPALIALSATCRLVSASGERVVPVEQFCTGPGRNVLQRGEVLVSVNLPPPQPRSGAHYLRFIPRNEMDIAVVGVGASVVLSGDGSTVTAARIALGAVGPTPILATEAGQAMIGRAPSEEAIARAAALARQAARPITDMRGTAAYRVHLVGVLTARALRGAIRRANGGTDNAH